MRILSSTKKFRRLSKAIKKYGLVVASTEGRSGHMAIFKDGERIYTFAGTPSVTEYAEHNTFHALKKMGYIPKEDKRI